MSFICRLTERSLIRVSGAEAEEFLQSLVTQDMKALEKQPLVYSCLLTPQGKFLHDLFISKDGEGGFFLECEEQRREDIIRRLIIFRLRVKVAIEDCESLYDVYVAEEMPESTTAFKDPRLKELGYRFYLPKNTSPPKLSPSGTYMDMRIRLGVPEGSGEIKVESDTIFDANLDKLHAVSWDKGCYVGQEVTARMNYRALVKKRMAIVSGENLSKASILPQAGEMRAVNSSRTEGLAVVKLAILTKNPIKTPENGEVTISFSEYT